MTTRAQAVLHRAEKHPRPPAVWSQSRFGRCLDLVNPTPEQVDFKEIAETLSQINRFNGASEKPINVAQHTLIAFDLSPEELRPWVLLHDAHEWAIGDITTPVVRALDALYGAMDSRDAPSRVLAQMKILHDMAIHAAAGLPMPSDEQKAAIRTADLKALVTERRDFLPRAQHPWAWSAEIEAVPVKAKRYGFRSPMDCADELYARFRQYLPALQQG